MNTDGIDTIDIEAVSEFTILPVEQTEAAKQMPTLMWRNVCWLLSLLGPDRKFPGMPTWMWKGGRQSTGLLAREICHPETYKNAQR